MKSQKTIDDLVAHVYKIYKEPVLWWSKAHYEKRCIQIYAAEVVLQRCFDNPLADPEDVIDGYLMEVWYMLREEKENANIIKMLRIIEETLESLLRYLH